MDAITSINKVVLISPQGYAMLMFRLRQKYNQEAAACTYREEDRNTGNAEQERPRFWEEKSLIAALALIT